MVVTVSCLSLLVLFLAWVLIGAALENSELRDDLERVTAELNAERVACRQWKARALGKREPAA